MPSRRSHQNSHHGCTQCKQRRVKCDETRPACLRCHRQGRECTYTSLGPGTAWAPMVQSPVAPAPPAEAARPMVKLEPPDTHSPPTPSSSSSTGIRISSLLSPASPGTRPPPVLDPQPLAEPHRLDLKLMHHWASRCNIVVPCSGNAEIVWRDFVASQALEHEFLLHALFAVSAFHLAATQPEDRELYKDIAHEHHSQSIALAQPALKDINRQNCHALFAFSCLTAIISFATPHLTETKSRDPLKEVIGGFQLWRGTTAVLEPCFDAVAQGPMSLLFYIPDLKHQELIVEDVREALNLLEERNAALDVDDEARQSCARAISQLYILFASCTLKEEEGGLNTETAVFGWPILVPKEYLDTLWKAEPMALAILAHYAVMLHRLSHVWWAANWGSELVDAVVKLLDDSWEPCLRWPQREVHRPAIDEDHEVD